MIPSPVIYIVDDEPDHRLLLAATLREVLPTASIREAADSQSALQTLRSSDFDVVLCDYRLRGATGLDLFRQMQEEGVSTPFVLITEHGSEETARQAFMEGAADYITKEEAFRHPSRFGRKIRQAIERRRLELDHHRAELLLENFLENNPYAILICDPDGKVVRWNRALTRLMATQRNLVHLRRSYSPLRDPQLQEAGVTATLRKALSGSWVVIRPLPWDPARAGFEGSPRILRGVAFATNRKDGSEAHLCLMIQDVTVEETARRERDEFGAILSGLLNASPAAIFFIDLNQQVRFANHCVGEFFGIPPHQAVGNSFPDLLRGIAENTAAAAPHSVSLQQIDPVCGDADDLIELTSPRHRFLRRQCRPVAGPDGTPIGHLELYTDETPSVEKQHDLEEQNRELDAFASRLAHDLKTPLVSLKGFADLLDRQFSAQMEERSRLYLEKVRSSADILSEMVDGLRDLAHAGKAPGRAALVEPLVVLRLACENLASAAQEYGVQIRLPPEAPTVRCDRAKLFQIFQNLISNAIRYRNPAQARRYVAVEARPDGAEVVLTVKDNGLGLAPEDMKHVFEPFWRGNTAAQGTGMGLGLAITRRLIEAAAGRISVESQPGAGTTFTVVLPGSGGANVESHGRGE